MRRLLLISSGQITSSITWTGSIDGNVSTGVTVKGPDPKICSCADRVDLLVQGGTATRASFYEPICNNETIALAGRTADYSSSKVYAKTVLTYYASELSPRLQSASNDTTITAYQTPKVSILTGY